MNIFIATAADATLVDAISVYEEIRKEHTGLSIHFYQMDKELPPEKWADFKENIANATIFIYDSHGTHEPSIEKMIRLAAEYSVDQLNMMQTTENYASYFKFLSLRGKDLTMNQQTRTYSLNQNEQENRKNKIKDWESYITICSYWRASGTYNWQQLFYFLASIYGNTLFPDPLPPKEYPDVSILNPKTKKSYNSMEAYLKDYSFDPQKPTVAFLYLCYHSRLDTDKVTAEIMDHVGEVANVLPIGLTSLMRFNREKLWGILLNGDISINLLVNFLAFRLGSGPSGNGNTDITKLLEELDVPMLHPYFLSKVETDKWMNTKGNRDGSELLVNIALPEMDGAIETYPVAALKSLHYGKNYGLELKELVVIEERVKRLTNRINRWITLQTKRTKEKRVAIIAFNYPPGEANLFGGAFLDTFATISKMLKELDKEGYLIEETWTEEEIHSFFMRKELINSGKWTSGQNADFLLYGKEAYEKLLQEDKMKSVIEQQWGKSPGKIMTNGKDFFVPGVINGNIFVGLQPSRGIHENPELAYHDDTLQPTHQYIAYYQWLREEFKADVIVHVGTHGTLEFLPGKEVGLSEACMPDKLIGDLPHLYYYYIGNPAEASIAKRRSHATIVSYQAPPFVESELYDVYAYLDTLLKEHQESIQLDPVRTNSIEKEIIAVAEKCSMTFESISQLEAELYRMKRSMIPSGLHRFGEGLTPDAAITQAAFSLRYDRKETVSIQRLLAEEKGWSLDELLDDQAIEQLALLDTEAKEIVESYIKDKKFPNVREEQTQKWQEALSYADSIYFSFLENKEREGLLKGLAGTYLPAKLSGDVVRNPEILPTGYNVHQLDPTSIPSMSAINRGMTIGQQTISIYKDTEGTFPETTAFILWGIETARTQGETIGQILYYLGVKLKNSYNRFKREFEIIPIEALGRPRLNVLINISGIFRDMFPGIIADLHALFKEISCLDETEEANYFKKHTNKIYAELVAEGYEEDEAFDLACARLFGPSEGEYGTNITNLIETSNWEQERQLGDSYTASQQYVYSENHYGKKIDKLFQQNLEAVKVINQIRSDFEYEVTDLDHYYEYFGGLSKAIENQKGEKVEIIIADTTMERIQAENVQSSINRGVRTRITNPKWIDGLLNHPVQGTMKIAKRFDNLLGLAATTNKVEQWVFNDVYDTYIRDENISKRMEENNRFAYHSMIETLLECNQRQYWNADDEQVRQLQIKMMELEGEIEGDDF
ncbi:cobaltochelatase subunit CobN [Niallia alba]|uniref:cobaltochelatase subunit CobN n=1 Tax=Niallia alba TaxID=2729105 RepID=UPI0039A0D67D